MDSRVCIREHVSVGEEARRVRELVGCMCDMKKTASVSVREREREYEAHSSTMRCIREKERVREMTEREREMIEREKRSGLRMMETEGGGESKKRGKKRWRKNEKRLGSER